MLQHYGLQGRSEKGKNIQQTRKRLSWHLSILGDKDGSKESEKKERAA
jgi:hypothetical protein